MAARFSAAANLDLLKERHGCAGLVRDELGNESALPVISFGFEILADLVKEEKSND